MKYQVILSKAIRRHLNRLPGNVRNIARQQIISLSEQPRPGNAKELEGHPEHYRMWIMGKFRLVWYISEDEQSVDILYVGPKSPELYAYLGLSRTESDSR
ncbi:MAG TPA: hypothetical protein ENK58_09080 [Desulfobacterales bacterium]|nr:MAG: hypothetical protein DRI57_33110 [Deltaproteobacteria bacterium]HHC25542.1 hypothetical protein [Desulfobacterales bacterium]